MKGHNYMSLNLVLFRALLLLNEIEVLIIIKVWKYVGTSSERGVLKSCIVMLRGERKRETTFQEEITQRASFF